MRKKKMDDRGCKIEQINKNLEILRNWTFCRTSRNLNELRFFHGLLETSSKALLLPIPFGLDS